MVYNPVRKLVDNAEIDDTDLDDEFAALKNAIDTGKSRYDELQRYIQDNNGAKENFLKDILNRNFSVRGLRTNMAKYSLEWLDSGCFLIIFSIVNANRLQHELGDISFYNVRDELVDMLADKINETMESETVRLSAERFAAIVKGERADDLEKYLIEQVSRIEYRTSVEIKVFISDMIYRADDLGKEYYKISEKVSSSLMHSRAIVEYGDSLLNKNMLYYPIELEKNLIENTLHGAKESVKLRLERLFEENFSDELPERDSTQLIFGVTATVNRILQVLDVETETVFGSNIKLYNELALCKADSDMKNLIENVFMHLCEFIEKQNEEQGRDLADEMLRFVDENYSKEISLYDIAEKFNYSIHYISRAFTRETGRNFKDYLSMVRVAKAKDLLRSGNYTIAQVTSMVGCTNANSFIRMFKRCEGITPGQYVESTKKKQ